MFFRKNEPSELDAARAAAKEEVRLRLTKGRGRFSPDKRYITLSMTMYRPDGSPDGHSEIHGEHYGVWEAQFSDPKDLLQRPAPPAEPMNAPIGPVEHLTPSAQTKAIWVFEDRSSIMAIGPAISHLIPLPDGSFLFTVCCAQTITGGTGRYAGASGLKTSLGSTHIPAGVDLFGGGDVEFEAQTIDTFRIVTKPVQGTPPPPPPQAAGPQLGRENPPAGEAAAIQEITEIHVNLMRSNPGRRGPHQRPNGCVAALFHVRDDIPRNLRVGVFRDQRSYLAVVRFSCGGSDDDRKPDAHAMAIKLVGVAGPKLQPDQSTAETQDFILCDHPVFIVRDVREMVDFEKAKAERSQFHGSDVEFARTNPQGAALLDRFARSGFLKPAKGSPFAAEYWSQTPSALGAGTAVKYYARPWVENANNPPPGDSPDFLRKAMHDCLVVQKKPAYFDFSVECQTDPVTMPVEDPTVRWIPGPEGAVTMATVEILPLPFESSEQSRFCEALSFNPWHSLPDHRPLGGINRARRLAYQTTSDSRHNVTHDPSREPTALEVRRLWRFEESLS